MQRNPVWLGFLTIIAIIAGWFINQAVVDVLDYQALSKQAPVEVTEWRVIEVNESHFIPEATYRFTVGKEIYEGATGFELRSFRNEMSCLEDLARLKEKEWTVWYDPEDPNHSALDKWFPLSSAISGGFMLAIFGYFIWLGRYVARRVGE